MGRRKAWKNDKVIKDFKKQERYIRDDVQADRIKDLETVVPYLENRDRGTRELILFVYRETLRQMGMPLDRRLRAVSLLNQKFAHPLSTQEALVATGNTTGKAYCFSNDFLIFILRLTIEDEKALGLRTIRSQEMNQILRWEEEGHGRVIPRKQESQEVLLAVRDMLEDGFRIKDITASINVSKQALYRLLTRWNLKPSMLREMTREELIAYIGYDEEKCVKVDTRTSAELAEVFKIKLGRLKCKKFNPAYFGRNSGKETIVELVEAGNLPEIEHPVWVFSLEKRVKFAYAKDFFEVFFYQE